MLMAFAHMSVKKATEMLKATLRKWGKEAEESVEIEYHWRDFDRGSVLKGVSNDRGDTSLSFKMRYEYAHLEATTKERNPKLVLPLQCENSVVKDEKDRALILVNCLTALYGTMMALLILQDIYQ
jgi:hypothetical protein